MNVTRLFDLIPNQLEKHPLQVAFAGKENGNWITYSSADFKKYTDQVSYGLLCKRDFPGR